MVAEMWQESPVLFKQRMTIHLQRHFLHGDVQRLASWGRLSMIALEKVVGAKQFEDIRWMSLSSTLCTWFLRAVSYTHLTLPTN